MWFMLVAAAAAAAALVQAVPYTDVVCQRYTVCNGMMCDDVCEIGTVQLDEWVSETLAFQRSLQFNRSLISYEMPGTHNGGMALDYGMGIEAEYLEELLLPIWGEDRSHVTIANQAHSLTDQLRMGVRHVEVDIYYFERLGVRICHWPVCPPDFYIIVERAAEQQGIELEWECAALGCDERKPFYADILREVRAWMDLPENKNEVVTLYLDNKNIDESQVLEFIALNEEIVGDIVFRPTHKEEEYPNRWPTIAELVAGNRRLIIEQQNTDWKQYNESEAIIWTPAIWDGVQFGPDGTSFQPFPSCQIDGRDNYNTKQSRSLDGSLVLGPAFLWDGRSDYPFESVQALTDCSVHVQALDQISPAAMEYFTWSWQRGEPSASTGCALLGSNGRWHVAASCDEEHFVGCIPTDSTVSATAELQWVLSTSQVSFSRAQTACPSGYQFALPLTGRMNKALANLAGGQEIWVNLEL